VLYREIISRIFGDEKANDGNISHEWLLNHIPLDSVVLRKWLHAGYVEKGVSFPTAKGTPQGGIISPILANMTLDGLERAIHDAVPRRSRVNFVRYADDFIVTGKSKRLLMIRKLNQALRGWAYYHRHVVASRVFNRVDQYVYECLRRMLPQSPE